MDLSYCTCISKQILQVSFEAGCISLLTRTYNEINFSYKQNRLPYSIIQHLIFHKLAPSCSRPNTYSTGWQQKRIIVQNMLIPQICILLNRSTIHCGSKQPSTVGLSEKFARELLSDFVPHLKHIGMEIDEISNGIMFVPMIT